MSPSLAVRHTSPIRQHTGTREIHVCFPALLTGKADDNTAQARGEIRTNMILFSYIVIQYLSDEVSAIDTTTSCKKSMGENDELLPKEQKPLDDICPFAKYS